MKHIFIVVLILFAQASVFGQTFKTIAPNEAYYGLQEKEIQGVSIKQAYNYPIIRHLYRVNKNTLALTIHAQAPLNKGTQEYVPHPTDSIFVPNGKQVPEHLFKEALIDEYLSPEQRAAGSAGIHMFFYREGKPFGWIVGREKKHYWPIQPMLGEALNIDLAENVKSYKLYSVNNILSPSKVYRKTKPHKKASTGSGYGGALGAYHEIYLEFDGALTEDEAYVLRTDVNLVENSELKFTLDSKSIRSEAIQVNQNGYELGQASKQAFLSFWLGNGGSVDYSSFSMFEVCEAQNGNPVFKGEIKLKTKANQPELTSRKHGEENQSKTNFYVLDFSELNQSGKYYVHIIGLGKSFDFEIKKGVWEDAFKKQMFGFYAQRSGCSLEPEVSAFVRKRNFHPEDTPIRNVDKDKFYGHLDPDIRQQHSLFDQIKFSIDITSNNMQAWGGWADAADYDRNIRHVSAARKMIELYLLNPEYFENQVLTLPETENQIPDIIDEALWCLELWRRTQEKDGEVIYGIESIAHPRRGEPSWYDSLPVAVIPGSPSDACTYASAAALAALAFNNYDAELADKYLESAKLAYQWAKENISNTRYEKKKASDTDRILASLSLYKSTSEKKYEKDFTNLVKGKNGEVNVNTGAASALFFYQEQNSSGKKTEKLKTEIRNQIIKKADRLIAGAKESNYFLLREPNNPYDYWIIESRNSSYLIFAHQITNDDKYLNSLVKASQFSMGANPLNLSYTTGIGTRYIEPFLLDCEYGGINWPVGIAAYGPSIVNPKGLPENSWGWDKRKAESYGNLMMPKSVIDWPMYELYFRYMGYPAINEFTVHQGMAEQLFRWGYLASIFND